MSISNLFSQNDYTLHAENVIIETTLSAPELSANLIVGDEVVTDVVRAKNPVSMDIGNNSSAMTIGSSTGNVVIDPRAAPGEVILGGTNALEVEVARSGIETVVKGPLSLPGPGTISDYQNLATTIDATGAIVAPAWFNIDMTKIDNLVYFTMIKTIGVVTTAAATITGATVLPATYRPTGNVSAPIIVYEGALEYPGELTISVLGAITVSFVNSTHGGSKTWPVGPIAQAGNCSVIYPVI